MLSRGTRFLHVNSRQHLKAFSTLFYGHGVTSQSAPIPWMKSRAFSAIYSNQTPLKVNGNQPRYFSTQPTDVDENACMYIYIYEYAYW